jgi:hypothetical protein
VVVVVDVLWAMALVVVQVPVAAAQVVPPAEVTLQAAQT